jgi:hypothetical protein
VEFMKRMRTAGLCLCACALSAVFATSAFALGGSPPEYGRCLAHTGGFYKTAGCLTHKAGEEKFEWYPYSGPAKNGEEKPIVKKGFTSESKAETLIQLEGTGEAAGGVKTKVICKENVAKTVPGETGQGELTGLKNDRDFNIAFHECESGGSKCSNTTIAGEIMVNELASELVIEKIGEVEGKEVPSKDKLGNRLTPKSGGSFARFTCAGLTVEVQGAVISPIKTNAMVSGATVKFTASGGSQKPECALTTFGEKQGKPPCDVDPSKGGTEEVLLSKFETIPGAEFEESGQTLTTIQTNEEKLEARVGAE